MRENLKAVFEERSWSKGRADTSLSGFNASLRATRRLRAALPQIFVRYGIKSFVDAPCGDWFWMQHVDLSGIDYTGWEISQRLVDLNQQNKQQNVAFVMGNITSDPLSCADLVMCRDTLVHLKFDKRWDFFENFVASGSTYLLSTHWFVQGNAWVYRNGGEKPISFLAEPFSFGEPLEWVAETADKLPDNRAEWADSRNRAMGLWHRDAIVARLNSAQDRILERPERP